MIYCLSVGCAVLAITTGKKRYSCLSDRLCCCIVFCTIFCMCISTLKKNPNFFLGFQIPPIFCISQLARAPSKRILKKAPSKRIRRKFLCFRVQPIFCISQVTRSKRILKKILGFHIPPIFFISHLAPSKSVHKHPQKES